MKEHDFIDIPAVTGDGAEIPQYIGGIDRHVGIIGLVGAVQSGSEEQRFPLRAVQHDIHHLIVCHLEPLRQRPDAVCGVIGLTDDDILTVGTIVIEAYCAGYTDNDQHII